MLQLAQETIDPSEPQIIQGLIDDMLAGQQARFKPGTTARRDLHSKSHGTVKGEFRILPNLPAELQVGLFSKPATYRALVRMSNGTPGVTKDAIPNVRGFAVKLLDVPGEKILPGQETSTEHDFVLSNHPVFFVRHLKDFPGFSRLVGSNNLPGALWHYPSDGFRLIQSLLKLVHNPLQISYFSQAPYLFGDGRAVKYAAVPFSTAPLFPLPKFSDGDFLRHNAENLLREHEAFFTFCVQFQRDAQQDPIEDSGTKWTGPLVPVAHLVIDTVTESIQESDGESLSFNPWRVLKEHRPLGWVGRVRRPVYATDFEWRTKLNAK